LIVRALAAAALIALAGCNKGPATGGPNGPVTGEPNGPVATGRASSDQAPTVAEAGSLPPLGPVPRFVGRWAADQKACTTNPWQFTATTVRTPEARSCTFKQVSEVPGGYDVQAVCTAKAPELPDLLKIRFAESAKAMLFESKTIGDGSLVFCGRDA
jgi:hypothetical protein